MKLSTFLFSKLLFFSALNLLFNEVQAQEGAGYWKIQNSRSIKWELSDGQKLPHSDNIEMAGKRVAGIVTYAVDTSGVLSLNRQVFFPQLHPFIKSDDPGWFIYRAYLKDDHGDDILPKIFIGNKRFVPGKLKSTEINGMLNFEHHPSALGLSMTRSLFPSPSERLFVEQITLKNTTANTLDLKIGKVLKQYEDRGTEGRFITTISSDAPENVTLSPNESFSFSMRIMAQIEGEPLPEQSSEEALKERNAFLKEMGDALILETPNPTLNTLFEFSKIRGSESIFESKLGLIHSPGGGRYYVGVWANDQAEYINPYFPFLGYDVGNESAMSTYRAFAGEMNDEYKPLRYAFEIEGLVPPFTLDRGDAAMIAYGASQYALALGDKAIAEELWPLITWCLEYNRRKLNEAGVVISESDEMEGRIETGNANLSTASLYYGALDHTADLAVALGKGRKVASQYRKQAKVEMQTCLHGIGIFIK